MKDRDTKGLVIEIVIGLMVAPMIIRGTIELAGAIGGGIEKAVRNSKFQKEMKKGIKEGRIIKIDGKFYGIQKTEQTGEEK